MPIRVRVSFAKFHTLKSCRLSGALSEISVLNFCTVSLTVDLLTEILVHQKRIKKKERGELCVFVLTFIFLAQFGVPCFQDGCQTAIIRLFHVVTASKEKEGEIAFSFLRF
jgi:hypothetical protein